MNRRDYYSDRNMGSFREESRYESRSYSPSSEIIGQNSSRHDQYPSPREDIEFNTQPNSFHFDVDNIEIPDGPGFQLPHSNSFLSLPTPPIKSPKPFDVDLEIEHLSLAQDENPYSDLSYNNKRSTQKRKHRSTIKSENIKPKEKKRASITESILSLEAFGNGTNSSINNINMNPMNGSYSFSKVGTKQKQASKRKNHMPKSKLNRSKDTDSTSGESNKTPQRWTKEEDDRLRRAVKKCGGRNWKQISDEVNTGKSHIQCLQRWKQVLQPGLVKGSWSKDEDEQLIQLMRRFNSDGLIRKTGRTKFGQWKKIEKFMNGRTAKQCRERWVLNLDPNINKAEWTKEEDLALINLQSELGNSWSKIKHLLNTNRTENAVKLRFNFLNRIKKKYGVDNIFEHIEYTPDGTGSTKSKSRRSSLASAQRNIIWTMQEDEALILGLKYYQMDYSNKEMTNQLDYNKSRKEIERRWKYLCMIDRSLNERSSVAANLSFNSKTDMMKVWDMAAADAARIEPIAERSTPSDLSKVARSMKDNMPKGVSRSRVPVDEELNSIFGTENEYRGLHDNRTGNEIPENDYFSRPSRKSGVFTSSNYSGGHLRIRGNSFKFGGGSQTGPDITPYSRYDPNRAFNKKHSLRENEFDEVLRMLTK